MKRFLELLSVALISAIGAVWFVYLQDDDKTDYEKIGDRLEQIEQSAEQTAPKSSPVNYAYESGLNFKLAAKSAVDQVVHVMSKGSKTVQYSSPLDFFFGGGGMQELIPTMSSGSGVIISTDGYIVTNNHVIENANEIEVILNNKQSYEAKIIGRDRTTDLALLKIKGDGFSAMPYGDSEAIDIGEWVLAIGNPFNLNSTVTAGIVSAKARSLGMSSKASLESFIQTDAAVNPGNSGGALINTKGELIGINTAIASKTGSYVGYSFAVPVNIVKKVVADLIEFGEVQRALLGVSIYELNAQTAKKLGVENLQGVYVNEVFKNGAADEADIKKGDIITEIDQMPINSSSELFEKVGVHSPGDKIKVKVIRDKKEKIFDLTLKNQYNGLSNESSEQIGNLGAKFKPLSKMEQKKYGVGNCLQVVELYPGKFRKEGIKEGFIINKVNHRRVESVEKLKQIMQQAKGGGVLIEGFYPNGAMAYYAIGVE